MEITRRLELDDLECKAGDKVKCIFNGKLVTGKINCIFPDLCHGGRQDAEVYISDSEFIYIPLKFLMKDE